MLIDSHCHLDYLVREGADLGDVVARAGRVGVGGLLTIGTRFDRFADVLAAARPFPNVWCSVGIHPHEAETEIGVGLADLVDAARDPKVVAIGETGLDYYYDHSPRDLQRRSFAVHIAAAQACDLPIIVHTRDADDDTARILGDAAGQGRLTGVLHCFSSGPALAESALALGFYISISGIVTFKNADALRSIVKTIPLDRLLVETDSPYLAPVPKRGKPNEPAYVVHTAQFVADLLDISLERLAKQTTDNFFALFRRAQRDEMDFPKTSTKEVSVA